MKQSQGNNHHKRTVFVTFTTRNQLSLFDEPNLAWLLLDCMQDAREVLQFEDLAHVILPDHIHWMVMPADVADAGRIVGTVKRSFTQARRTEYPGHRYRSLPCDDAASLWKKRIFRHTISDFRDFHNHLDYIHYNPVKHGLVRYPVSYRFSSFRNWCRRGFYTETWGTEQPLHIENMMIE